MIKTTKPRYRFEENAEERAVTGWVCRTCGRFHGDYERGARWCCATDMPCECGGRMSKSWTKCDACREKAAAEKWAARTRQAWDGSTPLYSETLQRYFFDEDYLLDAIADEGKGDPGSLRLVICDPVFAHAVDDELWCDDLPEDSSMDDVNGDIAEALAKLNDVIAEQEKANNPISWQPGKVVAIVELSRED